jgi:hypothetical protein
MLPVIGPKVPSPRPRSALPPLVPLIATSSLD